MPQVAILGPRDAVLGLKASGVRAFVADNPAEAREALSRVLEGGYAVLFVTESAYRMVQEEMHPIQERNLPIVSILTDVRNPQGIGRSLLKRYVERAVGTELAFKGEE